MESGTAANGGSAPTNDATMTTNANQPEEEDIDPIWLSSRTARQIYGLSQVEKVSIRYHPPRASVGQINRGKYTLDG